MASVEAVLIICSCYVDQSSCESDENSCENCFRLQDYLKVLTAELKSTQLIVKLLQDELKTKVNEPMTTVNQPTCVYLNSQDKLSSESVCESGWIEIWRNNHVTKQLKKTSRCLKQLSPCIPLDDNRFSPLSNLQDQVHHSTYDQDKSQPTHSSKTSHKNQCKVILLGDSHIRGCSEKMADLLGNSYSVIGITKPNANLSAITNLFVAEQGTSLRMRPI